jgi:hypothetical protein
MHCLIWLGYALCRAATQPLYPLLQQLANSNPTTPLGQAAKFYAAFSYVPAIQKLQAAAAAYSTKHGVLFP